MIWTHRCDCCERQTLIWLKKHKVPYHDIRFNKPGYDLLIDDKAIPPYGYLSKKYIKEYVKMIKKWDFNRGIFDLKTKKKR